MKELIDLFQSATLLATPRQSLTCAHNLSFISLELASGFVSNYAQTSALGDMSQHSSSERRRKPFRAKTGGEEGIRTLASYF